MSKSNSGHSLGTPLTTRSNKQEHHSRKWLWCFVFQSVPGRNRTCDLLLRRQSLYPTELRGQVVLDQSVTCDYVAHFESLESDLGYL